MASEILGVNSYLTCWSETSWGTKPGSPTYFCLPVETFDIKSAGQSRSNRPYCGQRWLKHKQQFNTHPTGSIGGSLHGYYSGISTSLAQFLFDLAFGSLTDNESPSFGCEWAEGPNVSNRQFNGLRCDQLTINGSASTGRVDWSGSFVGKSEGYVTTAQTVPSDLEKLYDFCFYDAVVKINDAAIGIESFTFAKTLAQQVLWLNSKTPSAIKTNAHGGTVTLQFPKTAKTYDDIARLMAAGTMTEADIEITLTGHNNGTGADNAKLTTKLVIDAPRCIYDDVNDTRSIDAVISQGLTFTILKPDSSTAAVTTTWTEET